MIWVISVLVSCCVSWPHDGPHQIPARKIAGCASLQWRHNERDSVSNHQPHDGLLNRLFRRRSQKTSKLGVTGLCAGDSPGTGEFPAQMASNAENVSIWWRHHVHRECGCGNDKISLKIVLEGPTDVKAFGSANRICIGLTSRDPPRTQ